MISDEEVLGLFSENYAACRHRFCDAAQQNGWHCESHPIDAIGPDGATLAFDVAVSPAPDTRKTIVVSSGVHGVEGFFGSAVQLALLNRWSAEQSSVKFVFLHGLNPYGFAWLRRFDQNNVDPNRNFLLPGELFAGAPPGYASLDSFLNPCRPPSRWEPFLLKAMLLIAWYGKRTVLRRRKAVANSAVARTQNASMASGQPYCCSSGLPYRIRRIWRLSVAHRLPVE